VLAVPDAEGEVEVQLGAMKRRSKARDVERLSRRQSRAAQAATLVSLPTIAPTETPDLQRDLRGRRVEEVLPEVDRYLNDAYLAGMPFVRLLHGKGTGALRQAIRNQLAHHPLVREFASAGAAEGGEGVTVVALIQ